MSSVKEILKFYNLYPYQGEKLSSNAIKIFTGDRHIVLKRTSDSHVANRLHGVYNIAKQYQLSSIVPLYLTKNQQLFVKGNKHTYYVTPWIKERMEENSTNSYFHLLEELGKIHGKTKQIKNVEGYPVDSWAQGQKEKVRENFNRFERCISSFEAKHFMSPAELLLCYQYRQIRDVCQALEYWYDQWSTYMQEDKKTCISLCHGQLDESHYIPTTGGTVILNWEKAYYGEPIKDLTQFYYSICQNSDIKQSDLMVGFEYYQIHYTLQKSEIAAFAIHLLHVDRFMRLLFQFMNKRNLYTEVEWIRKFEVFNFYFKHALFIQNQLKENLYQEEMAED